MFPYKIKPIKDNVGKELVELFKGQKDGFVKVEPKNYIFPSEYIKYAENYYNLPLREDDVFVMTFPRSGTTLMQEIVWLINNDLDFETASKVQLTERVPFMEYNIVTCGTYIKEVAELNNNDPKQMERLKIWEIPVIFGPYWEHLKEGWALRNHHNFLFIFYEDLLRDLPNHLKKISKFLNKTMTEEQIQKLADHVHIDNFRKVVPVMRESGMKGVVNPDAQGFVRRGQIGGNPEFDDNLKARAEKWFKENLAKTDIIFPKF